MIKQEFDKYIKNYRSNLDNSLWLSGESSTYFAAYKAKKLKEWVTPQLSEQHKILDFGCGDGVMTSFVSKEFPKVNVYGVDPSPKSIEEAKRFENIKFSVSSDQNTKLNFEDNYFDVIYAAGAFHHIPFSMHEGYMQELMRITKPGGKLVIFELNPLNPLTVYTFNRNPIDQDATMLKPWYAKKLANTYGKNQLKFYCFFPKVLGMLRSLEKWMTKVPASALYAVIIEKTDH